MRDVWLIPVAASLLCVRWADGSREATWTGTVDTLPDGRVVVTNPSTAVWDSASAWTIEEELRIGSVEGTGPDLFASIAGLEVDALGRFWVLDRTAKELRVFAPDVRTYARSAAKEAGRASFASRSAWLSIRREGSGSSIPRMLATRCSTPPGAYLTAHQRQVSGYSVPWRGGFDDRACLLEASNARTADGYRTALLRHDSTVTPVDTIFVPE